MSDLHSHKPQFIDLFFVWPSNRIVSDDLNHAAAGLCAIVNPIRNHRCPKEHSIGPYLMVYEPMINR